MLEATDAESDAQAGARDHSHALTMLSPDGGSGGAEPAGETDGISSGPIEAELREEI